MVFSLHGAAQDTPKPEEAKEGEAGNPFPLKNFYVQKAPPDKIRKILSYLHVGLTTGYGRTDFQHILNGYDINQGTGNPVISDGSGTYSNWISNVATGTAAGNVFKVEQGSDKLGFRSKTGTVPIGLTLHVNFKYFRIGAGYTWESLSIGDFQPLTYRDKIQSYKLEYASASLRKYYGQISVPFYSNDRWVLMADWQVGNFKLKSNFNSELIKPQVFSNLGVKVEYSLSEYLQVYARPSYETKNYTLAVGHGSIKHTMNTACFTVGFTYSLPELPRCFHEQCHAQINHSHGNKSYRSRMHPFYKKQNPGYGENYPNSLPKK